LEGENDLTFEIFCVIMKMVELERLPLRIRRMILEILKNGNLILRAEKGHVRLDFAGDSVVFTLTLKAIEEEAGNNRY